MLFLILLGWEVWVWFTQPKKIQTHPRSHHNPAPPRRPPHRLSLWEDEARCGVYLGAIFSSRPLGGTSTLLSSGNLPLATQPAQTEH